jgi:hypothetical protein
LFYCVQYANISPYNYHRMDSMKKLSDTLQFNYITNFTT